MYEMERQVYCSNIASNNEIRNSAVVDILQDASNFHLEYHPVMAPFFEKENCVMYLISRQIDILRRPVYGEKIRVKTWTFELKRMYGYRNTVVYGEDGKPCILGAAGGAFMDTLTQKPIRIPQELVEKVPVYERLDMEYKPRKIVLPDTEPQFFEPLNIRKCDIDMNKHVNNARYVDITDEYLPEDAVVTNMRIEYKIPVKRGMTVVPAVYNQGNTIIVSLNDTENRSCCIVEYVVK